MAEPSDDVKSYLEGQRALVRRGDYWNCLTAARELARLLLAEGRSPWIARLRKTRVLEGGEVFRGPLIPRGVGIEATWTTHYVCCCEGFAYEPLAGAAVPLESYGAEVFGEEVEAEVFVTAEQAAAELRA